MVLDVGWTRDRWRMMIYAEGHWLVWSIQGLYNTCAVFNIHGCLLTLCLSDAGVTVSLEERTLFIGYRRGRKEKFKKNDLVTFLKCFCQLNCGLCCIERSWFKILNCKRILELIKVSIRVQFKLFKVTTIGYTQWNISQVHMSMSSNILEMFLLFCWKKDSIWDWESP